MKRLIILILLSSYVSNREHSSSVIGSDWQFEMEVPNYMKHTAEVRETIKRIMRESQY